MVYLEITMSLDLENVQITHVMSVGTLVLTPIKNLLPDKDAFDVMIVTDSGDERSFYPIKSLLVGEGVMVRVKMINNSRVSVRYIFSTPTKAIIRNGNITLIPQED